MARKRSRSAKGGAARSKANAPRTISEGVTVHAVRASSGRPATTVHVEVDAARVERQVERFEDPEEVVAEFPNAEGGDQVRWEEQRLARTSDAVQPGGERTLRYSGTRLDRSDVARYGIGVRLKTPGGTLETRRECASRDADKPGDDEGTASED